MYSYMEPLTYTHTRNIHTYTEHIHPRMDLNGATKARNGPGLDTYVFEQDNLPI